MQKHTYHRWMLALPCVVVIVVLTLWEGMQRDQSVSLVAPTTASETAIDVALNDGAHMRLDVGASITPNADDSLTLEKGSLLVSTPGLTSVQVDGWTVLGWNGAFHVTRGSNGAVTVVALDVPVLVLSDHGTAVIPAGEQWQAKALPRPAANLFAWRAALKTSPVPAHFLEAQQQILETWERTAAAASEPLTVTALAEASDTQLAHMLSASSVVDPLLLSAVRSRQSLRLYTLIHPAFRDAAWIYAPEDASDTETKMAALLLPRLDQDKHVLSQLTVERWGNALADLEEALPTLETDVTALVDAGHPERALAYAQEITDTVSMTDLSSLAASAFSTLSSLNVETLRASLLTRKEEPVMTVPVEVVPHPRDPALELRAREALEQRGVMFTKESIVKAVSDTAVEVQNVVIGLADGDHTLHMEYDVTADAVRAIMNGVIAPYASPFKAYLEWEARR